MDPKEPTFHTNEVEQQEPSANERFIQDLNRVNSVIIELLSSTNPDAVELREAWTVRAILAEEYVDSLEETAENPNLRTIAQLFIMVDKAKIFEKTGNVVRYLEDLDAAEALALNFHLDELADPISTELDEKSKELGQSPQELLLKLRGYISFADRDYLRELLEEEIDYDDLLGNIYGMIIEEDENADPDKVFAQLGITQ